ncbi:MAG TPA: response regulator transcription factor [Gemmatimonadaceae bacterium]|jgi:two-component system NarL family response regulator|nr:response regulator transcription factor [Gemmatimonadaceae bacterium]
MTEPERSIRVLLADDHAIVRDGIAQILNGQPDITVVAQAAAGIEAVELYARTRPDVALVDLRIRGVKGVQVVEHILERFPRAVIVMLTAYATDDAIEHALRAGAKACLLKDVSPHELVACVRAAHAGIAPAASVPPPAPGAPFAERVTSVQLTARELAVLRLVAAGQSDHGIAQALAISDGTAQAHVEAVCSKLDVMTRGDAVAVAVRRGLVRKG